MKHCGRIAIALAACLLAATSAFAEAKEVHWKLAMTWNSTLTPLVSPPMKMAQMVSDMTGGKFVIKVEGAEKHKAALEILDMIKGGQYEMGHSASYYWKGKDPATTLFTTIPFGMTPQEQGAWLYYGGGLQMMQECYDKFGIYIFPGGNTGIQMGGWFRKEIKSLDDLKGLKMRIPSVAGEVFAKLGVNVTNIPPGELYTSLERGAIDALEWVAPGMDIKMGFHKIAPYYYTGWHEPASDIQFFVNKKAFDALPLEYQAALKTAMQAAGSDMLFEGTHLNNQAWSTMKTEFPNIKIMTFPEPVLQAMKKATDEVLDEYAAKDPFFKEVLDSQRSYLKQAREWTRVSDLYYLQEWEKVNK